MTSSLEDYLHTSYRPDCHFVDDHTEERHLGDFDHSRMQAVLAYWFHSRRDSWRILVANSLRVRVSATCVRVADVCILRSDSPREQVIQTPPLLCIEVLSPEDDLPHAAQVMEDYARMGVEHLWLLDPAKRIAYRFIEGAFHETAGRLEIPSTPIHIDLAALFASLD